MTERLLVTGAQGLLGRQVVAHLLDGADDVEVLGLGRSPRTDRNFAHDLAWRGQRVAAPLPAPLRRAAQDPRFDYARVDLVDEAAVVDVLAGFAPTTVIHSAVALRDEPWDRLFDSNVRAVATLVAAVADMGGQTRLVLVSSGSVYGASPTSTVPHREDDPCTPLDLYAASKRCAEDVGRILAGQTGTWIAHGRVFNLLGPGLQDRHLAASLAGQLAAIRRGVAPPVLRVGPLETTRDFIDVREAARGLVAIARHGEPGSVVNVASGEETPVERILNELLDAAGLTGAVEIEQMPGRPADMRRSYADVGRLHALAAPLPITLRSTLADMLAYYLDDEAFPG